MYHCLYSVRKMGCLVCYGFHTYCCCLCSVDETVESRRGHLIHIHIPTTVVPSLGDPRRERPTAVYGHVINVPTHVNVTLPAIGGHLPNADADSHLLVVRTYYNGQCKQIPRFRWSFQPKIANSTYRSRQLPLWPSGIRAAGLISTQSANS